MNAQSLITEAEWKQKLCPLEQVKKWRNGFSVRCPRESVVGWCTDKDESILRELSVKRSILTCSKCRQELLRFLQEAES